MSYELCIAPDDVAVAVVAGDLDGRRGQFNFAKRTKKLFLKSPFALLNCYIYESVQKTEV